ncbi:MAG: glycosyl hydrolase 2 galactose-binding domain-containing protein [Solirubrobacteraceae bacterium]
MAVSGRDRPGRHRRRSTAAAILTLALSALLACAAPLLASAAAETTTLGLGGWQVQSSALVTQSGAQISSPGFATGSWLSVTPDDGGAVGTEIGALLQNGVCPDVFYSENLKSCFGYMSRIGSDTVAQFAVPWWFRTNFQAQLGSSQHAQLIINGIVGQADLWVNGQELATQATLRGAYARYTFDLSGLLRAGANSLALELYPNDPTTMFTLDDVDWNEIPPDNNTGIQFPVQLHVTGALALEGAHVSEQNAADLSSSALTLKGTVSNGSASAQSATVSATVSAPSGGAEPIMLSKALSLAPHARTTVAFTPAEYPQLEIADPQVWWPYQMGAQPLYGLSMTVSEAGSESDSQAETFGIRTVGSYLTGVSPIAPHGVRRFTINGRPLLLRGGGWAEDLFLRYSATDTAEQIALIKNLGLNAIRTEGKEMPEEFYEQMDRAGILIDAGFQCCDAWQPEHRKLSKEDDRVLYDSALTIGRRLRNHPSVIDYSWSDNAPTAKQAKLSLKAFAEADFEDPLIASAEYTRTHALGPSGEKEGPYDWVPPSYWYDNTHFDRHDPTRTNVGGAWGFDSEASAGDTVPTLDSIERFMSPLEQSKLWQEPTFNQYHTNYEAELPGPKNYGYSFGTLFELDKAIAARFGAWSSLDEYVEDAQVQNYETQRAEFEAYIDHSTATPTPSTGIFYWQLNKGMPTLLWDLYNQEFDQAGSYFGAKKANEALHVFYAYDNHSVNLDNLTNATETGLSVESKVYALDGQLLDDQSVGGITLGAQGVANTVLTPKLPASTVPPAPAQTYFVELLLRQGGAVVDRNVYWLSSQQDQIDWQATLEGPEPEPHATMSQYADLSGLHQLPQAALVVSAATRPQVDADGDDTQTSVTITNTSSTPTVAFFLRADIRRGNAEGVPAAGDNEVLPTFWSDNDITLWPGESETLTATYNSAALDGQAPVVSVSGWNVPSVDVAAP